MSDDFGIKDMLIRIENDVREGREDIKHIKDNLGVVEGRVCKLESNDKGGFGGIKMDMKTILIIAGLLFGSNIGGSYIGGGMATPALVQQPTPVYVPPPQYRPPPQYSPPQYEGTP